MFNGYSTIVSYISVSYHLKAMFHVSKKFDNMLNIKYLKYLQKLNQVQQKNKLII